MAIRLDGNAAAARELMRTGVASRRSLARSTDASRGIGNGLGDAGLIFAGFDVHRARPLDRLGQLLELGGESLEFADEKAALPFLDRLGGVDQRFEHHRDARQDRFLDPLERLVEARLLVPYWHRGQSGPTLVKSW